MTARATVKTLVVTAAARGWMPARWCPIILQAMGLRHA